MTRRGFIAGLAGLLGLTCGAGAVPAAKRIVYIGVDFGRDGPTYTSIDWDGAHRVMVELFPESEAA